MLAAKNASDKAVADEGKGKPTFLIFADSNKKYLSTDLLRDEPVRNGYLAPDIELLHYEAFNRVCLTCLYDSFPVL